MPQDRPPGFTLIELAIVLVIIGLILAAIMKGGAIFHSAQISRVNKGFFEAWKTVVYAYYDRRGQYLGDGTANGGTVDPSNGRFDGFMGLNEVNRPNNIIEVTQAAGLDICAMIQSDVMGLMPTGGVGCGGKNIFQRTVSGEYTGKINLAVGFFGCTTENGVIRNCLVFTGVPNDVAQRLDTHYDGAPDGRRGIVRILASGTPLTSPIMPALYLNFPTATEQDRRMDVYNLVMILQF